jgi:hypothetical protein
MRDALTRLSVFSRCDYNSADRPTWKAFEHARSDQEYTDLLVRGHDAS